mmetsp:Transcript_58134/g.92404  ORF Transcript_58134/g.92404 Transcript_58134/m.92404 type:complete len:105 (-) Transcript_58134:441-755(-)
MSRLLTAKGHGMRTHQTLYIFGAILNVTVHVVRPSRSKIMTSQKDCLLLLSQAQSLNRSFALSLPLQDLLLPDDLRTRPKPYKKIGLLPSAQRRSLVSDVFQAP